MASKVHCPYCYEYFYLGECNIVATAPYKTKQFDIHPGDVLKEPKPRSLAWMYAEPLTGPLYTHTQAVRQCPHCHKDLPQNIGNVQSYTIAIIGDSNSGVSMYIGSLLHELKERKLERRYSNISQGYLNNTSERVFHNYYEQPMFINKQKLSATMPGIIVEPLIYEFVIQAVPGKKTKRVNLIFYNTAGEDIVDQQQLVQFAYYLFHASGIIFLADPFTMPGIAQQFPPHIQLQAPRQLRSSDVLNRVLHTLGQGNTEAQQKFSTPLAITLSKADVLASIVKPQERMYSFLSETDQNSPLKLRELRSVSNEVRTVIEQIGDKNLLKAAETCSTVEFFAVSATGWQEDSNGQYPAMEPIRCLEPLIWILWQLGVIEATQM